METPKDSVVIWRHTFPVTCFLLLFIGAVYHVLFLRTFSHWWFEDDPVLFALVCKVANPLRLFFDRGVIQGFSSYLVPMQLFSMWIDNAIAYRSVRFAQIHHLVSPQVFVNTIILLGGGYWLGKTQPRSTRAVALVLSALILISGAGTTAQEWQWAMDRYRFEGIYYLAHQNQLIYSELPAFWYLRGLHDLYAVPISHHV